MQKPTKSQFGWTRLGHWINGDQDGYELAMKQWKKKLAPSYPRKTDYGWLRAERKFYDWQGEHEYKKALARWKRRKTAGKPGRPAQHKKEPHESWLPYLELFDSKSTTRSLRAFERATGVRASTVSVAKFRKITVKMEEKISIWIEELKK